MTLAATSALNKAVEADTFGALATAVAARLGTVSAVALTGEQKFNSLVDSITVDALASHYKSVAGGSLPSSSGLIASRPINSTTDETLLSHVVKFIKDQGAAYTIPVNSVAPVIGGGTSGPWSVTNTGTWSAAPNAPDSFTYQWQDDTVNIPGATLSTAAANLVASGHAIRCLVTAINEAGSSVAVASNSFTKA